MCERVLEIGVMFYIVLLLDLGICIEVKVFLNKEDLYDD